MSLQGTCAVCGRTILAGEKVHSYVSAEGRHEVCPLCDERAAELGWLPADQDGAEAMLRAETERKPGFLAKLFARPEREERVEDDEADEMAPPAPGAPRRATHELETERYDVEAEWTGEKEDARPSPPRRRLADLFAGALPRGRSADLPRGRFADLPAPEAPHGRPADLPAPEGAPRGRSGDLPAPEIGGGSDELAASDPPSADAPAPDPTAAPAPLPDPAGRGMRPRRLQPDLPPANRFERAISRFNSSEAGRTVAGLTRTLGAPSVSVGDSAGAADEVRVTVAWELTWYQWGVDLGDELRPVYELDKGFEVGEIDAAARQWNASAHDGRIVMVAPGRREAADGKPVHR